MKNGMCIHLMTVWCEGGVHRKIMWNEKQNCDKCTSSWAAGGIASQLNYTGI